MTRTQNLALITCNSCDAIDEFTAENPAGYCRECWAEVRPAKAVR